MKDLGKYKKSEKEFLELTFYLSEKELQAVDHMIPMTQELYESIVEKCSEIGADFFFQEFILEYPEFLTRYAKRIEREVLGEKERG